MEKKNYEKPTIEVFDVEIEKGFAASPTFSGQDEQDGPEYWW